MWTYDEIVHLMVVLDTIIEFATITYIVRINLYKLHQMNDQVFNVILKLNRYVLLKSLSPYFPHALFDTYI